MLWTQTYSIQKQSGKITFALATVIFKVFNCSWWSVGSCMWMSTALTGGVQHSCHFIFIHRGVVPVFGLYEHVHFVSMYTGETKGAWANVRVTIFSLVTSRFDRLSNYTVPWVVTAIVLGENEEDNWGKCIQWLKSQVMDFDWGSV